jgi:hypothetical protein
MELTVTPGLIMALTYACAGVTLYLSAWVRA